MSRHNRSQAGYKNKNKQKHNDWVCERCNNYNYSFRIQCNRCHVQLSNCTRDSLSNTKLLKLDKNCMTHCISKQDVQVKEFVCSPLLINQTGRMDNFPYSLLLALSEQSSYSEEYPLQQRDMWDNINHENWICKIIE